MRSRLLAAAGMAAVLAWHHAPAAAQSAPGAALDPRLLQPLALADCVDIALANNLELRIARLDQAAAATGISAAKGAFWPVLGATVSNGRYRIDGEIRSTTEHATLGHAEVTQLFPWTGTSVLFGFDTTHFRLDPDRTDTPAELWTFSVTQPLLRGGWWNATNGPMRAARRDTEISDANLEASRRSVIQQVKSAYYEALRGAKLVEVNRKAVERDEQLVLESKSKLDAGLGTKRDVLSAEIQREQDRGKLVDAETQLGEALDGLARVLGLAPGVTRVQVQEQEVGVDSVGIDHERWVAKALRDNPALRASRLAVARAEVDLRSAANARLPQLDVAAVYTGGDDPDLNEINKDLNRIRVLVGDTPKDLEPTQRAGWAGVVTLSYPLGNRTLGAEHKRARLAHQLAQRGLDDAERQVTLDVRSAIRALENNVERLAILRKSIDGARDKLEFASINFQLGRASNLDITDAQKDLLDAETDYVNEVIDYKIQLATIEALLGGFE